MSDQFADKNFENAWFSSYRAESTVNDNLSQVQDYAYRAFDKLDKNKNGFIEMGELQEALKDQSNSQRERSFITFLIKNHQQIAESYAEPGLFKKNGISRQDLQAYFKLVQQRSGK